MNLLISPKLVTVVGERTSDVTNSIGCTELVMTVVAIKKKREADSTMSYIVIQRCINLRNSVVAAGMGTSVAVVSMNCTELVATIIAAYTEREKLITTLILSTDEQAYMIQL